MKKIRTVQPRTRTLKELYPLVLKSLEDGDGDFGICYVIWKLYVQGGLITEKEEIKLSNNIKKQKPTARNKFKSFYNEDIFQKNSDWWWKWMEKGFEYRAVRIAFIKAVISTLK